MPAPQTAIAESPLPGFGTSSGGTGITSIGWDVPSYMTMTPSPITSDGSVTLDFVSQAASRIFASPAGSAGVPLWRVLDPVDIPQLNASIIGSGLLSASRGGTGIDGAALAAECILVSTGAGYAALGAGGNGQVLTISGGAVTWQNASSGFANPMTDDGDLITQIMGTAEKLGIGSSGQVLTVVSGLPSWQDAFIDPMTSPGDIIIRDAGNTTIALAIGIDGQVLTVNPGGYAYWANATPMTSAGDIIIRSAGNITTRLALGTFGYVLTSDPSGAPAWQARNPMTSSGDIYYRNPGGIDTRLAIGNPGQVLTVSGGSIPTWANATPMSTIGDIIIRNASNVTARLGAGSDGDVLTVVSGVPAWVTFSALVDPTTTDGDTIYRSGGILVRLGIGTAGQVLTVSGGLLPVWQNAAGGFVDPMITDYDLITRISGIPARVGIGTNGQVLTVVSGTLAWQTPSSGFADPMTAVGDMIYRDLTNTTASLALGTTNQFLRVVGGVPTWTTVALFTDPMTTIGDILYRNSSNVTAALPLGTTNQFLRVVGSLPTWTTVALFTDPMTTIGDILYRNGANVTAALPLGTANQFLRVVGSLPTWTTVALYTDPMTTIGDILYRNGSNVTAALPLGTSNQFLRVVGSLPTWTTVALYTDPMTTIGDMLYRNGSNVTAALPLGTTNQFLRVVAGLPTWTTVALYSDPMTTIGDIVFRDGTNATASLAIGSTGQVLTVVAGIPAWTSVTTTFADNVFRIQDNGDATKQLAFELSGIASATTRTITVPNRSFTLDTPGGSTGQVQYNSAGLFAGSANFTYDGNTITLAGNTGPKIACSINSSNNNIDMINTGSGNTLAGTTTSGIGVVGATTSGTAGVYGSAVNLGSAALYARHDSSLAAQSALGLVFENSYSGAAATGLGVRIDYKFKSSTTSNILTASSVIRWSDATHATRTSEYALQLLYNAGTIADVFVINGSGATTWNMQTSVTASVVDTVTFNLNSTGTPSGTFGHRLAFYTETTTTNSVLTGYISTYWSSPVHLSRTGAIGLSPVSASLGAAESFVTYGAGFTRLTHNDIGGSTWANVLNLRVLTSGTPAAGHGAGMIFSAYSTSSGAAECIQGMIKSSWIDATHASQQAKVEFFCNYGGNQYLVFDIRPNGINPILNIAATGVLAINGTQVLAARDTGWASQTATPSKADLGASPTNGALAQFCAAIDATLKYHGMTGT